MVSEVNKNVIDVLNHHLEIVHVIPKLQNNKVCNIDEVIKEFTKCAVKSYQSTRNYSMLFLKRALYLTIGLLV